MTKLPPGRFNSFRKPVRQEGALPPTTKRSIMVWRPKLNDRVQIPKGIRTEVEISEDIYLLKLDRKEKYS
jgi:hypothetical protein